MHRTFLLLKRLLKDGRAFVPAFGLLGAVNLLLIPVDIAALLMSRKLIDQGFLAHNWDVVRFLLVALILLFLLRSSVAYATALFSVRLQLRINARFQDRLFGHMLVLPMRVLTQQPVGRLMSRILDDGTRLSGIYDQLFGAALIEPVKLLVLAVLLMFFNVQLFFVLMTASAASLLVIHRVGNRLDAVSKIIQEKDARLYSYAEEMLSNVELVKARATESVTAGVFGGLLDELIVLSLRIHRITLIARPLLQVLKFSAVAAVLLIGSWMIATGGLSLGTLTIFAGTSLLFFNSLNVIGNTYGRLRENLARLEAVYRLLDTAPEQPARAKPNPRPAKVASIALQNVCFGYRAPLPVLKDISLEINRGQMVGITGQSGSGKTTLTRLLMRFYSPDDGFVLVNGTPLEDIALADWRAATGIVFQENLTLNDTIANNIAYGTDNVDQARLLEAARICGVHEFVRDLPHGYDTVVGELGRRLSGGQRQRLAIARAIVSDPQVLILDEGTSYLEVAQEEAILMRIKACRRDKITILVSHRPSAIRMADRVLVLDQGRLIDFSGQPVYGIAGRLR